MFAKLMELNDEVVKLRAENAALKEVIMNRKEASRLAAKKAAAVTNRIKALKKLGLTHEAAKAKEKEERELLELLVAETDKL